MTQHNPDQLAESEGMLHCAACGGHGSHSPYCGVAAADTAIEALEANVRNLEARLREAEGKVERLGQALVKIQQISAHDVDHKQSDCSGCRILDCIAEARPFEALQGGKEKG